MHNSYEQIVNYPIFQKAHPSVPPLFPQAGEGFVCGTAGVKAPTKNQAALGRLVETLLLNPALQTLLK